MNDERSELIAWIRSELVGPARPLTAPTVASFADREFTDSVALRNGPLAWRPAVDEELQEVLYFDRETPHRKYGAGLLHPALAPASVPSDQALQVAETLGVELGAGEASTDDADDSSAERYGELVDDTALDNSEDASADDFEVTSPDVRHPSTIGISFCVQLDAEGEIVLRLPQRRFFPWQRNDAPPFPLNGRYEPCTRRWVDEKGQPRESPVWRRVSAVAPNTRVAVKHSELIAGRVIRKNVPMPDGSPLNLCFEVFPRQRLEHTGGWLLTVVLRNSTSLPQLMAAHESVLYQTFFDVEVAGGSLQKYPESQRPFAQLDSDEQSLALLYRESATWGIGHGCAAGWDAEPGETVTTLYADVMPAVQLPSMTPEIEVDGAPVRLSMRELAGLSDDGNGTAWDSLVHLSAGYAAWILQRREEAANFGQDMNTVARRHLDVCDECLRRINTGIALLRNDARVRHAFRLANLAMLLQQIGTKQLVRRPLFWDASQSSVAPQGEHVSPWDVFESQSEDSGRVGSWRAFQIAFLMMSLDGVRDGQSPDRTIVDLVWFPTGGGKTEAYLAVTAFYMFHERLLMAPEREPKRDGTNALMRYTLRMLTTQQFQRAATLICAMEFLRRNAARHCLGEIPGRRFSLGLWIGRDGSPNKIDTARTELSKFRSGDVEGNPLVLTECPWCRAEIGRFDGQKPPRQTPAQWNALRTRGISDGPDRSPLLHCADNRCQFGQENASSWIPVEVIDERIYRNPPSLVIATADKLAMISYRPEAGALFGRQFVNGELVQTALPPGLIIQDELHLISGPLGTMYALYEGIFERLCSYPRNGGYLPPKIIASTATIRGAHDQVRALYGRGRTQLFPSPCLDMGDSFFGRYARSESGALNEGRLYLGVHASDYGSVLTTQVRTFSSAIFRPWSIAPNKRDAWWTLLAFYNSLRELGGAKTLFDSDIRSRLKFVFNREGYSKEDRRNLRIVEELTSRLTQAEIVRMIDRLSAKYSPGSSDSLDACLASNIIEVGVDIERLSLLGVVGQPKTTATYIQVTGRVGRNWRQRPGLILMIYNPSKSRDRSHFEQFHSYHRRLYERVEPTTATPFSSSAIQRGLPGALIAWARQFSDASVQQFAAYSSAIEAGFELLADRCEIVQSPEDRSRSLGELQRIRAELEWKWQQHPQLWEEFPPKVDGEYLMLWPGQFSTAQQKRRGVFVPTSMRQVDRSAELEITQGYAAEFAPATSLASNADDSPERNATTSAGKP